MGRAPSWWTEANVKLIKENFVAVAVPTWVAFAKGPEGEFLRSAGINKLWATSSGYMTFVTAGGKVLAYPAMRDVIAQALKEFKALPEEDRRAGAVKVPDLKPADRLIPPPPPNGLVLRVHGRFLSRDKAGKLRYAKMGKEDFPLIPNKPGYDEYYAFLMQPNTEYMWLTEKEWKSLVPSKPVKGKAFPVAPSIVERLARFHVPAVRLNGSGGGVPRAFVKSATLSVVVDEVSPNRIRLGLEGFIHLGSKFDAAKATSPNGPLTFGQGMPIRGILEYDRKKNTIVRFDMVAVGDIWGRMGDANGNSTVLERPGRNPIGFAFELAGGDSPTNRLLPGGGGIATHTLDKSGYFSEPYFTHSTK